MLYNNERVIKELTAEQLNKCLRVLYSGRIYPFDGKETYTVSEWAYKISHQVKGTAYSVNGNQSNRLAFVSIDSPEFLTQVLSVK